MAETGIKWIPEILHCIIEEVKPSSMHSYEIIAHLELQKPDEDVLNKIDLHRKLQMII